MLYQTLAMTLGPLLRTIYHPDVTGTEHIPADGGLIIASNHVSFADQVFTPLSAHRRVSYFAKAEYFTTPGIKGKAMAALFHGLGQVPVERADTRSAAGVIEIGVEVLRAGGALGIFPEGTRSPDGQLYKFRTGVARLALRSGAPVIPVGIVGTREVLSPDSRRWRRAPVGVHFGAPLYFGDRADQERSARVLREVTDSIRHAIGELSGQTYVDRYANSPLTIEP